MKWANRSERCVSAEWRNPGVLCSNNSLVLHSAVVVMWMDPKAWPRAMQSSVGSVDAAGLSLPHPGWALGFESPAPRSAENSTVSFMTISNQELGFASCFSVRTRPHNYMLVRFSQHWIRARSWSHAGANQRVPPCRSLSETWRTQLHPLESPPSSQQNLPVKSAFWSKLE